MPSGQVVAFEVVKSGSNAFGYTAPADKLIASEADWTQVWNAVESTTVPRPPAPREDFAKHVLVGVFAGEKRTGGYTIAVESIRLEDEGKVLAVLVRESGPPRGSMLTQAFTSPFQIVRVPRGDFKLKVTRKVQ